LLLVRISNRTESKGKQKGSTFSVPRQASLSMRLNASRCLLYPEENEAGTARVYGLSAELPSEDRKNEAAPIGIPGERLFVACRRIFESFGLTAAIGG
jgi:hypothetical protein